MRILVSTSSFAKNNSELLAFLKSKGEVLMNPFGRTLTSEEFITLVADCDGVIAGTERIGQAELVHTGKLKVISRCGVGMDGIDIDAAEKRGIKLFNTPDAPTRSVAEHAVALTLSWLKNIPSSNEDLKNGIWKKPTNSLIAGKNVGIIGMGRIGQLTANLFDALGLNVCYYDIDEKEVRFPRREMPEEILSWADIVSLHCSYLQGQKVITEKELKSMKRDALIVNTSRGALIDEEALYRALKQGVIGGAALDVYSEEPYCGKLRELTNVILTPHVASASKESRMAMEQEAVDNLMKGLQ